MQTVRVTERTGKDGVLLVRIPLGRPEADFDVVVVVQPKNSVDPVDASERPGWPLGYFDLAGSITDETFVRPPQGTLPPPADIG
jgi:hypothetical protein